MSDNEVLKGRKGVVTSYRRGKHKQHTNQVLLKFKEIDSKSAASALIGRGVQWISPKGKEILGKVVRVHGNNGVVRAKFRKNLPGQAIGTGVQLR